MQFFKAMQLKNFPANMIFIRVLNDFLMKNIAFICAEDFLV